MSAQEFLAMSSVPATTNPVWDLEHYLNDLAHGLKSFDTSILRSVGWWWKVRPLPGEVPALLGGDVPPTMEPLFCVWYQLALRLGLSTLMHSGQCFINS